MGTKASAKGDGDFEQCPAGTHLAICYMVADIGYQEGPFGTKQKLVIGWELPQEKMTDSRPFAISEIYTTSLSKKANLRADLEAWRGRPFSEEELEGFDVAAVLGKPCTLTVVHAQKGDKTYANISSVGGVMKGTKVPPASNPLLHFDLDKFDNAVLQKLPKWVQDKIEKAVPAPEPKARQPEPAMAGGDDDLNDDIPF